MHTAATSCSAFDRFHACLVAPGRTTSGFTTSNSGTTCSGSSANAGRPIDSGPRTVTSTAVAGARLRATSRFRGIVTSRAHRFNTSNRRTICSCSAATRAHAAGPCLGTATNTAIEGARLRATSRLRGIITSRAHRFTTSNSGTTCSGLSATAGRPIDSGPRTVTTTAIAGARLRATSRFRGIITSRAHRFTTSNRGTTRISFRTTGARTTGPRSTSTACARLRLTSRLRGIVTSRAHRFNASNTGTTCMAFTTTGPRAFAPSPRTATLARSTGPGLGRLGPWIASRLGLRAPVRSRLTVRSEPRGRVVQHGPHQLRLLGMEHGLDLDHAVLGVAATNAPALDIDQRMQLRAVALDERVLARQLLELRCGHQLRVCQEQGLVRWRRDARHRAHLRVRHRAAPEGVVDHRQLAEPRSDPDALARSDEIPAHAP